MILPKLRGNFFKPSYVFFKNFPIHTIDFSNLDDVANHDKIVYMVEQMLEMNKKLDNSKLGSEKEMIQRRIETTDAEINRLVYQLYKLTEEEIKIIEGK
jgi:predicted nucleotidyltransferase